MKRLLRSIIDVQGSISQENLVFNFTKLMNAKIEWGRQDDAKIYNFVYQYFSGQLEMPSISTVRDYFERIDDIEVMERLKIIEAAEKHFRSNFTWLLTSILDEQNRLKAVALLKEAHDIITRGLDIDGERKQGVRDGLTHFTAKANDLITPNFNARFRGDVRKDADEMTKEYLKAKNDKGRVWGRFTGIEEIDRACRGAKKGELWIHGAFPGELKCLTGSTTIYDHALGRRRTVEEMYTTGDLPTITALDREGESFRLVKAQATHLVQNGIRDVYELRLSSGRSIVATLNHMFFAACGWVELGALQEGCWVAVPKKMTADGQRLFMDAEVKVIGYLLGDGGLTQGIRMTASNAEIRHDFKECLVSMGFVEGAADYKTPSFQEEFPPDRAPYITVSHSAGQGNSEMVPSVRTLLDALGLYGKGSYEKFVPNDFFGLPEVQISLLLGALWSTDGSCHQGDHERWDRHSISHRTDISYASVSERLCLDVQALLLRLGIQSSVTRVDTTYKGEPYKFYTTRVVTRESKRLFVARVHVVGKESAFADLRSSILPGDDTPIPSYFVPEGAKVPFVNGTSRYASQVKGRPTMTVDTAKLFARYPSVAKVLEGDLAWEQVVSVTPKGREMTYDLSVPVHHSFVANDIVTHNTTFATNWCYNLVTRYNTNVLYVSLEMPYDLVRRNIYTLHTANEKWALQGLRPPDFAGFDYRKIRDGELSEDEEKFYFEHVIPDFNTNPNYYHFEVLNPDKEMTMLDIRMEAELLHKQEEIGFVVIDHGQWVEAQKTKKSKDYTIELNSVVRDAKRFAMRFNNNEGIPVLLLWQINRDGKEEADKNDGEYKLKAFTYANEVEKTADVVTTTYLNKNHREHSTTRLSNPKNRDNPPFLPFDAHANLTSRRMLGIDRTKTAGTGMNVEAQGLFAPLENV